MRSRPAIAKKLKALPHPLHPAQLWGVLRDASGKLVVDDAFTHSASLAYYTVFSIVPILVIILSLATSLLGGYGLDASLRDEFAALLGPDYAAEFFDFARRSRVAGASWLGATVQLLVLFFSATGVVNALKIALNRVWRVRERADRIWMAILRDRLLSLSLVVGLGFTLLISFTLHALVVAGASFLARELGMASWLLSIIDLLFNFGVTTLVFAVVYKVLPDVDITYRDVWVGAALTAALFLFGRWLMRLVLGWLPLGEVFGAASAIVALLTWVFYSSLIVLFGAECTYVYARRYGVMIKPNERAIRVPDACFEPETRDAARTEQVA